MDTGWGRSVTNGALFHSYTNPGPHDSAPRLLERREPNTAAPASRSVPSPRDSGWRMSKTEKGGRAEPAEWPTKRFFRDCEFEVTSIPVKPGGTLQKTKYESTY